MTEPIRDVPPAGPPAYRRTLLDRHGPDGGRILSLGAWAVVIMFLAFILCAVIASKLHLSGIVETGFVLVGTPALTYAFLLVILRVSDAAGGSMRVLVEGAPGSPYEDQFSEEQALIMKGAVDEALASFERRISAPASGVAVRIRAAEVYAGPGKNPVRAAELLREARANPALTAGQDVYVANRLVDLLSGPLDNPGRALVELRRIVERYPSSDAAAHARIAIANLKDSAQSKSR